MEIEQQVGQDMKCSWAVNLVCQQGSTVGERLQYAGSWLHQRVFKHFNEEPAIWAEHLHNAAVPLAHSNVWIWASSTASMPYLQLIKGTEHVNGVREPLIDRLALHLLCHPALLAFLGLAAQATKEPCQCTSQHSTQTQNGSRYM